MNVISNLLPATSYSRQQLTQHNEISVFIVGEVDKYIHRSNNKTIVPTQLSLNAP